MTDTRTRWTVTILVGAALAAATGVVAAWAQAGGWDAAWLALQRRRES